MQKNPSGFVHSLLIRWSGWVTLVVMVMALGGLYLGSKISLRLSLTDLLPDNHPAVKKLEELTEIVGGVGFFTVVLYSDDGKSHIGIAPKLEEEFKKSPLVRSAFYHREQRFFVDRLLYYIDLPELLKLEKNIHKSIKDARKKMFDIGLWEDEEAKEKETEKKPVFDKEITDRVKKSADVSEFLVTKDNKTMLLMIKPSFDSTDLKKTEELIEVAERILKQNLPKNVTYEFAERYYSKVVETKMITNDIFVLGTLSILVIALIIYLYLRSIRGLILIFAPVLAGMGVTIGLTYLAIGHINIITGFLMGIVSGLGVDYAIHLLLRLKMEVNEHPEDKDPVWETLVSSGHSVFVGAVSAASAFFLLCFSSFKAFSEFGFICGTGILTVLACILGSFSFFARTLKLHLPSKSSKKASTSFQLPLLSLPKGFAISILITLVIGLIGSQVRFEYDFSKMLEHSKHTREMGELVDVVYGRSSAPSAFAARTKEDAVNVEKMMKDKYIPKLVSEVVNGATIIPDQQPEKQVVLQRIKADISTLKDKWISSGLEVDAKVVRKWVDAKPFTLQDIPKHLQDVLRGTKNEGFLMYFYPSVSLNNAPNVNAFADMVRDIEAHFPRLISGSDAVVFSDILHLINSDGLKILFAIFISVGLFIWINVRKWDDTLLSYLPLIFSLPIGMGLMALFGVKFNIFNISIIPTFVAMGIDVPIHIVHRSREVGSGYKAARDLAASINLALITAGAGFGVLVFAHAGVLKSLGWIALLGTLAIWWVGLFLLPAFLEWLDRRKSR